MSHQYLAAFYLAKNLDDVKGFEENCSIWDPKYYNLWKFYNILTKGKKFPLQELRPEENPRMTRSHSFSPSTFRQPKTSKIQQVRLYTILAEFPDSYAYRSLTVHAFRNNNIELNSEMLTLKDLNMLATFLFVKNTGSYWI